MRFNGRRFGFPFMRRRHFFWGGPFFWRRRMFGSFTYLLLGGLLYKLYSGDVRRIEEDTYRKAEDLSVEELKAAMRKLGITRLEVTPNDVDRVKKY